MASGLGSARPSICGGSVTKPGVNSVNGASATSMTSAFPGATSSTRPKNPSGGLDQQPYRRRLERWTPVTFLRDREATMTALRFDNLEQYSDVLRSRRGDAVTVRFVEPRDAEELQNYFRSLSTSSRYNRFLGAMSELPQGLLDRFTHVGPDAGFTVI